MPDEICVRGFRGTETVRSPFPWHGNDGGDAFPQIDPGFRITSTNPLGCDETLGMKLRAASIRMITVLGLQHPPDT